MIREPLVFSPIYRTRVWGGRRLADSLGRALPSAEPIGESWEIVDRPEAQSRVAFGEHQGKTLRELIEKENVMGPKWPRDRRFPLLVKWLDCEERLSLQVHPPASVAPLLGGEPKTENWYVAEVSPAAGLLVGFRPGVDRDAFAAALRAKRVETCVNRLAVKPEDSLLVRSGQVHAIDAGCLILEIQQNSDTTYRVDDWGRLGLDGKPRELHIAESLASMSWNSDPISLVETAEVIGPIAECPEFRILRHVVEPGGRLDLEAGSDARIVSVVRGALSYGNRVAARGDNLVVGIDVNVSFSTSGGAVVLITENFALSR
ncbi:MAG TPA: type I phosphomannose isomerase catalytic subunit [Opitutaceae bacterium]